MTGPLSAPPSGRFLALLFGAGLAWRLVIDAQTPMPREDGVNYLWMAERFAAGAGCDALGEIFSPLLALVIAVPVGLGVEPFVAAQLALAVLGASAVLPVAAISEAVQAGTGRSAGLLFCLASRPVLLGAQVYTEPLFLLVAGYACLLGLRRRFAWCGICAGLAFFVRPEAALIPAAFVLTDRRALIALAPFAAAVAGLAVWRGLCGHGFDPVPKLAFIQAHNVAADMGLLARVAQVPGCVLEAFGATAILAVVGAWRRRPPALLVLLLLATIVICGYVPRWRFFVNWMFAVVPLAACALVRLRGRALWIAAILALELVLAWRGGSEDNRVAERQIAAHLRAQLRPGERIVSDMTRVMYFAGFRPLEPRHYTVEELVAAGRRARFVVLRSRRRVAEAGEALVVDAVRRGLPGYADYPLPEALRPLARARGVTVLVRE